MKQSWRKRCILFGAISSLLISISACANSPSNSAEETLRTCAVDGLLPYSNSDPDQPGIEVLMAEQLAERMDMKNKTVWVGSFDGLIPSLNNGNCDAIVDGLFITEEREKQVDFSDPTWGSGEVILTQQGNDSVQGLKDLRGGSVGVLQGSVTVGILEDAGLENLKTYPTQNQILVDLDIGRINAAYLESPSAGWALEQTDLDIKIVESYESPKVFYEGIAVQTGNDQLRTQLNKAIAEIQKDGTLGDILKSYGIPVILPTEKSTQ